MTILWIVFWIVVAVGAPILYYKLGGKNKIIKVALQLILVASVVYLGYRLYEGIMEPIRFDKQKTKRYKATVQELMRIRTAQEAYKKEHDKYTPHFDTLIEFVKEDSLREIIKIGTIPDSIFENPEVNFDRLKAQKRALEYGLIKRDTMPISIKDSLFKDYNIEALGKVPFRKNAYFEMDTAIVTVSGINIPVFEASVTNNVLLKGLNKQLIINLSDDQRRAEKFPGLKVGSLSENNNNEGNWSKELELKEK